MSSIVPTKEGSVPTWLGNFCSIASANFTALGLSHAQIVDLQGMQASITDELLAVQTAKEATKAAVRTKTTTLHDIETAVGEANRIIQAKPGVDPALKTSLGLKGSYAPAAPVVPMTPFSLTVEGDSQGVAMLKWKRAGNPGGTIFEVFADRGIGNAYIMIGSTNGVNFKDTAAKPGVATYYQVRARRKDRYSDFSNYAVLYPANTSNSILLKAA